MKIDKKTFFVKFHYFLFFAGMSSVLPYYMVYAVQLGIPIDVLGICMALTLAATVIMKPVVSAIADSFPTLRKATFLMIIVLTTLSFGSMVFVQPFGTPAHFESVTILDGKNVSSTLLMDDLQIESQDRAIIAIKNNGSCEMVSSQSCVIFNSTVKLEYWTIKDNTSLYTASPDLPSDAYNTNTSLDCINTQWTGSCETTVFKSFGFWYTTLMMFSGSMFYSIVFSFTDAIIIDIIGVDGNFGRQRAFGSLGWGCFGFISGFTVNMVSGTSAMKNYTPAFVIMAIMMALDIIVASRLQVPLVIDSSIVWDKVKPLFKSVRFIIFIAFCTANGLLGSVVFMYIFVLQEEMATASGTLDNVKLLQGFSVMCRSFSIVPFLLFSNRLLKRVGPDHVISWTFFVMFIRILSCVLIGRYGSVWSTLIIELLSGPSYGLACPTIVVVAGQMSPKGTSTTVQGLTAVFYNVIGYIMASSLCGILASKYGIINMFLIWAPVALVFFIIHVLYAAFRPSSYKSDLVFEEVPQRPEEIN